MSVNVLPSPAPENYEDFKIWSNENIKNYELSSFAVVEKSSEGTGWNINIKMKTDKIGLTVNNKDSDQKQKKSEYKVKINI